LSFFPVGLLQYPAANLAALPEVCSKGFTGEARVLAPLMAAYWVLLTPLTRRISLREENDRQAGLRAETVTVPGLFTDSTVYGLGLVKLADAKPSCLTSF
jgi:hypothetical protein